MKSKVIIATCIITLLMCSSITNGAVFATVTKFPDTVKEGNSQKDPYVEEEDGDTESQKPAEEKNVTVDTSWFNPKKQKKVYTLTTESQLKGLAELVNTRVIEWKVNEVYSFEGITIRLGNDIKMKTKWTPIGNSSMYSFKGVFDGNGHKIENLSINLPKDSNIGLFGYVNGTVKNLTVSGAVKSNGEEIGGIIGHLGDGGTIDECVSSVNVTGNKKVGGVVGCNTNGTIKDSYNLGKVVGVAKVGGVVGENWGGVVRESANEAIITSTGKGIGTFGTGGVAGRSVASTSQIKSCLNKGAVFSANECAGGIVGYTNAAGAKIDSCYNIATITGGGSQSYLGGIAGTVGESGITILNCYNIGLLKNADDIGGVLGSYIAMDNQSIDSYIKNNYYIQDNASLAVGEYKQGYGKKSYSGSIEPKTAGELRAANMPELLGGEYISDTAVLYGSNEGYPILSWQEEKGVQEEEDLLSKTDILYKKEMKEFYEKYPYGITKGELFFEMLNIKLYKERFLKEYQEWNKKQKGKKKQEKQ